MRRRWPPLWPCSGTCFRCGSSFAGGKGVATGFGVFLVAAPLAALAAISVFFVVLALSRYVSLASILGAASFPLVRVVSGQGRTAGVLHRRAMCRGPADHREASPEHPPPAGGHGIPLWSEKKPHEPYRRTWVQERGEPPSLWRLTAVAATRSRCGRTCKGRSTAIAAARENTFFLPGFSLADSIHVTADPDASCAGRDRGLRDSVGVSAADYCAAAALFRPGQIIVSATKGIENDSCLRMTEVIASALGAGEPRSGEAANSDVHLEVFTEPDAPEVSSSGIAAAPASVDALNLSFGAISGPTFALEVAQGQPTAITVAFNDPAVAARVQQRVLVRDAAALHDDGCDRGGAWRGAEECNRHRRRRGRRGRAWATTPPQR